MRRSDYICPTMKLKVQYWLDDEGNVPDNEHEVIRCEACGGPHLINRKSGKALEQRKCEVTT